MPIWKCCACATTCPAPSKAGPCSCGFSSRTCKPSAWTTCAPSAARPLRITRREPLRHYSVNTTRQQIGTLRSFFAHLENTDAILLDPTAGVPLAKQERRLPAPYFETVRSAQAVERAGRHAQKHSEQGHAGTALLQRHSRWVEMARLTVQDVDIKNGFVRITRGKGARDRAVPIGQSACEALGDYLKNARNVWMKVRRVKTWTDALWLSPIQPHLPLQTEAIGLIVNLHAKRVLGRNVSPHLWLNTFATHLVANGANIVYVQRLLGQKSLNTHRHLHPRHHVRLEENFAAHPSTQPAGGGTAPGADARGRGANARRQLLTERHEPDAPTTRRAEARRRRRLLSHVDRPLPAAPGIRSITRRRPCAR